MMSENFWRLVEEYQQLGFDPLRWIPTCSNEVDSYILQDSLKEVKRSNIKLQHLAGLILFIIQRERSLNLLEEYTISKIL